MERNKLIEDYERRLKTVNEMLTDKANRKEPIVSRLRAKMSCYRTFIHELNKQPEEQLEVELKNWFADAWYDGHGNAVNEDETDFSDWWKGASLRIASLIQL